MPDNLQADIRTGFDSNMSFDLKLDTFKTMNNILNRPDSPTIPEGAFGTDFPYEYGSKTTTEPEEPKFPEGFTYEDALLSDDPKIRNLGIEHMKGLTESDPYVKFGVGVELRTPYSLANKYINKRYGYDALNPDSEDYYYRNVYQDKTFAGKVINNIATFSARVVSQAALKLGQGLGYVGSMIASIGSDNYWADVADNALSKYLEGAEQELKDNILPVYKSAGFDEMGFFKKLFTQPAFWTDEVADAVAFMASAMVPGMVFAKLGKAGQAANWFGRAFSATSKAGKAASSVGMGSWAEVSSWTFNTAMESAVEGAGVFKEVKRRMEEGRAAGDPRYINLTDEQIRERAGNMAANTIGGNFAVLALSNAWENTLIFKPFKNVQGKAAMQADDAFNYTSKAIDNLGKSAFSSSLSRLPFYGKQAGKGFLAEGLWEENAQLAIQRINQDDSDGRGFLAQFVKQTGDAFSGRDKEAAESIGLGALIGIGSPIVISKLSGERKQIIDNTKRAIENAKTARQNLFSANDVYERDEDDNVVFDENTNQPKIDKAKLSALKEAYESEYEKINMTDDSLYYQSDFHKFQARKALQNYVRSMTNIGIEGIGERLSSIDPRNATLFGMDVSNIKEDSAEFAELAKGFEKDSKDVNNLRTPAMPEGEEMDEKTYRETDYRRRTEIYDKRGENRILASTIRKRQSDLLESLNKSRNLTNASLSQFPVDQLNTLIQQQKGTEKLINSEDFKKLSELEQEYYKNRLEELKEDVKKYEKDNELMLQDSERTSSGFYRPTTTDSNGNKIPIKLDENSGIISKDIAELSNVIHRNNYFDNLLTDKKDGITNFLKLNESALIREIDKIAKAAATATPTKYRELKKGDFDKVTKLVTKMVFGENQEYSPEELELQNNYAKLIDELRPKYEQAIDNQRLININNRIASLKNIQEALSKLIIESTAKIEDEKVNLEYLILTLEDKENQKKKQQRSITKAINGLRKNIAEAEEKLDEEKVKLEKTNDLINQLEQELGGTFRGVYGALGEMKKEIVWLDNKIKETEGLLNKAKALLKSLLSIVKQLFPNFDFKYLDKVFTDEYYGRQNKLNYDEEKVRNYEEIKAAKDNVTNLTSLLAELRALRVEMKATYDSNKAEIDALLKANDDFFKQQYLDLTSKPATVNDPADDAITNALTKDKGLFPQQISSGGELFTGSDYDGEMFLRPLDTKFFTSTFPWIGSDDDAKFKRYIDAPKDVQDYFDFLEYLTNPENTKNVRDKLKGKKLKVLIVTKNNVKELNLEDALSDRKEYLKNQEAKDAHIELIPVIEEGGDYYYTDANLNKLGKVGDKNPSANLVRTVLSLPTFTQREYQQYFLNEGSKYTETQGEEAVAAAIEWRQSLLDNSSKDALLVSDFHITRGIANTLKSEDKGTVRNPASTIIPEDQITGQSVRVFSQNPVKIDGENIDVPVGRPFIFTKTAANEQLHAANNNKLTKGQLESVSAILAEMIKDHITKLMDIVNTNPKLATLKAKIELDGLSSLTEVEKKTLYSIATKNNPALYNANYTNFLSSILHFNKREKGDDGKYKPTGPNQIYMKSYMLVLGDSGYMIDMTNPEDVYSPEVQEFLSRQNHNVRYFSSTDTASKEFIEYYLDGKELKLRVWKTYSHYLLSEYFPPEEGEEKGKVRKDIPITVSIKTKEQHELEKDDDKYYPYLSRGIVVKSDAIPNVKKKVKDEETNEEVETVETTESDWTITPIVSFGNQDEEEEETPKEDNKKKPLLQQLRDYKKGTEEETSKEETPKEGKGLLQQLRNYDKQRKGEDSTETPNSDIPDFNEGNKDKPKPSNPSNELFRVAKGGIFKEEDDLDSMIDDITRMIPQFPVIRLKKAIMSTGGIEAWGQFINDTIEIFEKAEKGTGYHEVFEAVVNKLLSDKEWNAIYKEFKSRKGSFMDRETGVYLTYAAATPHQAKEQMAEEFMDFKLTGKLPSQKQTRSFFQIILDFIKKYILNKPTIDNIFAKIDKGKFADRPIREANRFKSNYRLLLPGLKAQVKQDIIDGMSAFMFNIVFSSQESLARLDEIDLSDIDIYEPIKAKFNEVIDYLKNVRQESVSNENLVQDYSNAITYLQYAVDNWGEAVALHKQRLESFMIKFEEDDNRTESELNSQNRNDYMNDSFKTPERKSATVSIRFLFGTLLQKGFAQKAGNGKVVLVNNRKVGATYNILSSVHLAKMADSDKFMLNALEQFSGISDFSQIESKLRDLAGITEIEKITNIQKQREFIAGLSQEQAIWTSLYTRVFGYSQTVSPEAVWNLKAKLQHYLSKQTPEPYLFLIGGGNLGIISAVNRGFYENIIKTIESSIFRKQKLIFVQKKEKNVTKYLPNMEFRKPIPYVDRDAGKGITEKGFVGNSKTPYEQTKAAAFVKFLGLNNDLDTGLLNTAYVKSLSQDNYNTLLIKLYRIRNSLTSVNSTILNLKGLNIYGYVTKESSNVDEMGLIPFLDKILNISEKGSQFLDHKNNPRQRHISSSYISRLNSDFNNLSREEMFDKYPHLKGYFAESSLLLKKLYDDEGNRTSYNITLGYMSAVKNTAEDEGDEIAKIEETDKYWLQFNASLKGIHYTLPGDIDTEWVFNFGEFIPYMENLLDNRKDDIINKIFIPHLESEINTAINSNDDLLQFVSTHKVSKRQIGKSLRFFKNILEPSVVKKIHEGIDNNISASRIISANRKVIKDSILKYLRSSVESTIEKLEKDRFVRRDNSNVYIPMLEGSFVESHKFKSDEGNTVLSNNQFKSLVEYQKINSILGLWEQFKLFYGDPAQYKDWEKRVKSLFGPSTQTFYDTNGEFNGWLTQEKNSAELGGERVELPEGDWFRKKYTNFITARTINDFEVIVPETTNDLIKISEGEDWKRAELAKKIIGKFSVNDKDEPQVNEVDGQSIATLGLIRHLLIKSGWAWTKKHENFYQYDAALMRQELSSLPSNHPHYYDYRDNAELFLLDEKIVNFYKRNPDFTPINPIKPIMPSVTTEGYQSLLKNSVYPISYQVAKEFELLDVYVDMLKRGDDLINFKSAQKVGILTDNENKVTDYYEDPFTKNDIVAKGNPQFLIDLRTVGIQVETQTSLKNQSIGTQLTKDINLNLFENGVPRDFGSNRKEEWDRMSEEQRLNSSEYYRLVKGDDGTIKSLEALKLKNTLQTFTKLGIKWRFINGVLQFQANDLTKVEQHIKSEMKRLKIDENSLENVQLDDDRVSFINAAETLTSYRTIANKLWALADRSASHISVNGKPYIQVSSAFFNKKSRKAAYFDKEENKWVVVDNKADYDRLVDEGKKMVMTSSELKFYTIGEDGKTVGMEVYLPHIYKKKVNIIRRRRGLPELSDKELMDYLNENPKLLEGVGFRIPTQDKSSMEFFTIKGFLPEEFGSSIVVPSGITMKAGSDFDVDKLSTYLNNWKINSKGYPVYEEYSTDMSEKARMERYIKFVNDNAPDEEKSYVRFLARINKQELIKSFEEIAREIKDAITPERYAAFERNLEIFKETKVEVKNKYTYELDEQITELFDIGRELYHGLSASTVEYFKERKRSLAIRGIHGPREIQEYLELAELLKDRVKINDRILLTKMIEIYHLELDLFQSNRETRNKYLDAAKKHLTDDDNAVRQYYLQKEAEELALEADDEIVEEGLFNISFEMAKEIAELSDIPNFEMFSKFPIMVQNSKAALENRYFAAIRKVLELPDMFESMLIPNSSEHIGKMRDVVYKALGKEKEDTKELNYANFLSTEYIAEKRSHFTKGKSDIAIFAIGMTSYANAQVVGLGISDLGGIKSSDSYVFDDLNGGFAGLPFSNIPIRVEAGRIFLPISVVQNTDGELIMSNISSYITGAVDVIKDPAMPEMGLHSELAPVYIAMERMGIDGDTIGLFMMQPSIREYLRELMFLDRKTYFGYTTLGFTQTEIQKSLALKYGGKDYKYDPEFRFNTGQLAAMIGKEERIKNGADEKWTEDEKQQQFMAFAAYLKLKMYGNHILENVIASNHDTSSIRSSEVLTKKQLQLQRSKMGNMVVKIENDNVVNGAEALIRETFVKMDIGLMATFNDLFSRINLFALQKSNPQEVLKALAQKVYNQNPYISDDDFVAVMEQYKASIIDIIVTSSLNTVNTPDGLKQIPLYQYAQQLFRIEQPNNINNLLEELTNFQIDGKYIYRDFIKRNYFLQKLKIIPNERLGVYLIELSERPSNDDFLTKERITEGIREMAELSPEDFPEMNVFFKALIYGTYLNHGIKFAKKSFVDLIPPEVLIQLTKPAVDDIQNFNFENIIEQLQRSNWYKDGIIPEQMQRSMHFLMPTTRDMTSLELEDDVRSKTGSWRIRPTKMSQVFFGRYNKSMDDVVTSIHPAFIWGGYKENPRRWEDMPDIIKIPAVHPDYLIRRYNEQFEKFEIVPDSKTIKEMRKKGDHSYIFYQLYKKVGLEDKSLARKMEDKKSVSYLYKPIHKYGAPSINEHMPLLTTPNNTVIGSPSILNHPSFKEWEDNELLSTINDARITSVTTLQKGVDKNFNLQSSASGKNTITMNSENIAKVNNGTKTSTVRTVTEAAKIDIKIGKTETRFIGGKQYSITNRGYLTVNQAGGAEKMAKTEDLPTAPTATNKKPIKVGDVTYYSIYDHTKNWFEGKGKLYVYDIKEIGEDVKALPSSSVPIHKVTKVISGGQTGIDRLGLIVAKKLGIATGGTAPKGFRTDTGSDLTLKTEFGLTEHISKDYPPRTEKNIKDSDGTVLFGDTSSPGSLLTIRLAKANGKPYIENPTVEELKQFLVDNNIEVLNVAGNREKNLTRQALTEYERILTEALTNPPNQLYGEEGDLEFSSDTIESVSNFLNDINIEIRLVESFPNINAIAAANFIDRTVDIIDDLEKRPSAWNKLPEEAAHWWYRLLKNNDPLKKDLWDAVSKTDLYKSLVKSNYGNYSDIDTLKEEAIGQLIAQSIKKIEDNTITEEDKNFWGKFIEFIKSILRVFQYNTKFDDAAMRIISRDLTNLDLQDYLDFTNALSEDQLTEDILTSTEDIVEGNTIVLGRTDSQIFESLMNRLRKKQRPPSEKTIAKIQNAMSSIKKEKLTKLEINNIPTYESIVPSLLSFDDFIKRYKNGVPVKDNLNLAAKKFDIDIYNKVRELYISNEKFTGNIIPFDGYLEYLDEYMSNNYLINFNNTKGFESYRVESTFIDPKTTHRKIAIRFNNDKFLSYGHFSDGPLAWGNLTYFKSDPSLAEPDAVLIHEIQNDLWELLNNNKSQNSSALLGILRVPTLFRSLDYDNSELAFTQLQNKIEEYKSLYKDAISNVDAVKEQLKKAQAKIKFMYSNFNDKVDSSVVLNSIETSLYDLSSKYKYKTNVIIKDTNDEGKEYSKEVQVYSNMKPTKRQAVLLAYKKEEKNLKKSLGYLKLNLKSQYANLAKLNSAKDYSKLSFGKFKKIFENIKYNIDFYKDKIPTIEETRQFTLEKKYFTPLIHHLIQTVIKEKGKDFPIYFSGKAITMLTQQQVANQKSNTPTADLYAGPEEGDKGVMWINMNNVKGVKLDYVEDIPGFVKKVGGYKVNINNYKFSNPILYGIENEKPNDNKMPNYVDEAMKYANDLDSVSKGMLKSNPLEYLKFIAEQYWGMRGTRKKGSFDFTPGTGLDAIPDEIMEIAKKIYPESMFISKDNLPPINPEC